MLPDGYSSLAVIVYTSMHEFLVSCTECVTRLSFHCAICSIGKWCPYTGMINAQCFIARCFTVKSYEPEPHNGSDSHTLICFHAISMLSDLV